MKKELCDSSNTSRLWCNKDLCRNFNAKAAEMTVKKAAAKQLICLRELGEKLFQCQQLQDPCNNQRSASVAGMVSA